MVGKGGALLDSARIGGHMLRMRTFFAVVAAVLALAFAVTDGAHAQAQAGVPEVEKYFNSIRSLQARFVQSNPNGSVVQGTLYLRRPGRMRFEYDAPSQLKIVADGSQVTMWDPPNRDFGQWPIGWTAASFLVKEPFQLSGDLTVQSVQRQDGLLALTIVQTRKPQEGKIIVRVSENPMQLRGWSIIDNRGNKVDVTLTDFKTGTQLADSLFKYDGPDAGQILGGGRRN
jgi:outer membrane lipoprotein-sorting protein